jgi:hypothetical protein
MGNQNTRALVERRGLCFCCETCPGVHLLGLGGLLCNVCYADLQAMLVKYALLNGYSQKTKEKR